jgi:hypothetical protein
MGAQEPLTRLATVAFDSRYDVVRSLALPEVTELLGVIAANALGQDLGGLPEDVAVRGARAAAERIKGGLIEGRTVVVTETMTALAAQSAPDFTEVPLVADQMPSPSGWLWLEAAVPREDVLGPCKPIRAFSWSTVDSSVMVTWWTEGANLPDRLGIRDETVAGFFPTGLVPTDFTVGRLGQPVIEPPDPADRDAIVEALRDGHWQLATPDEAEARARYFEAMSEETYLAWARQNSVALVLQVIWALCTQEIIVAVKPAKPARKRAARVGKALGDPAALAEHLAAIEADIHVVSLRRAHEPDLHVDSDGSDVAWTHRWTVRPHWRWHWYGGHDRADLTCEHCDTAGGVHRRILVAPHVKGPADAPLLDKNRVDVLRR